MIEREDRQQRFSIFLKRHKVYIWKLCNHYADGNLAVGLDYVQEVAILLWLRFDKLRENCHPRQEQKWIHYTARGYFRDLTKKKKVDITYMDDYPVEPANEEECASELLTEYMICLSPMERTIVQKYIEGFSSKETAQELGMSPMAVRNRLHNAVKHMREYAQQPGKTKNNDR